MIETSTEPAYPLIDERSVKVSESSKTEPAWRSPTSVQNPLPRFSARASLRNDWHQVPTRSPRTRTSQQTSPSAPTLEVLNLDHRGNQDHMPTLTKEIIEAAIAGFEGQKQKIDVQIAELHSMLNGDGSNSATVPTSGTNRKFSPATLKRMREAQQRRWAKVRGESAPAMPANKSLKPKRTMSVAGRKAIADAQKKTMGREEGGLKTKLSRKDLFGKRDTPGPAPEGESGPLPRWCRILIGVGLMSADQTHR